MKSCISHFTILKYIILLAVHLGILFSKFHKTLKIFLNDMTLSPIFMYES